MAKTSAPATVSGTPNSKGREARQNREARRTRKALRHAEKRGASSERVARIKSHLAAIEEGKAPGPNMVRRQRRDAALAAQKAAIESKKAARAAIVVTAADGKVTEVK
jgi:hypothetical protein